MMAATLVAFCFPLGALIVAVLGGAVLAPLDPFPDRTFLRSRCTRCLALSVAAFARRNAA
jgi:hypothetical protein